MTYDEMYDELVRALRKQAHDLPEKFSRNAENIDLFLKAADAIENTSKAYQMMAEAYEAEATKSYWIPVTERLPEKAGSYLVYVYGEATEMNYWHGKWHRLGDDYTKAVTHWMPLPEPPKEEEET